jgi:hypothetical protein
MIYSLQFELIFHLKYLQYKLIYFKLSARFMDSKNVVERIHYISLACLPSAESKELAYTHIFVSLAFTFLRLLQI